MGLNPKSGARGKRLVDMSALHPVEDYRRPDDATLDEAPPMDIGDGHFIYSELWYLRGKIVWFALGHYYKPTPASPGVQIARVDCCGNTVHEHRYDRDNKDVLDHRVICEIPVENPGDVVHDAYEAAWEFIVDNSQRNVELWRGL